MERAGRPRARLQRVSQRGGRTIQDACAGDDSTGRFVLTEPVEESRDVRGNVVWVGGCPNDITEKELEKAFSRIGPVRAVKIKHSLRDTFAFVKYNTEAEARDAAIELNKSQIFGSSTIRVAVSSRVTGSAFDRGGPVNGGGDGGWGGGAGDGRGEGGYVGHSADDRRPWAERRGGDADSGVEHDRDAGQREYRWQRDRGWARDWHREWAQQDQGDADGRRDWERGWGSEGHDRPGYSERGRSWSPGGRRDWGRDAERDRENPRIRNGSGERRSRSRPDRPKSRQHPVLRPQHPQSQQRRLQPQRRFLISRARGFSLEPRLRPRARASSVERRPPRPCRRDGVEQDKKLRMTGASFGLRVARSPSQRLRLRAPQKFAARSDVTRLKTFHKETTYKVSSFVDSSKATNGKSGHLREDGCEGRDNNGLRDAGDGGGGGDDKCDLAPLVNKQRRGQVRLNLWQLPADFEEDELLEVASDFGEVRSHELWPEKNQMCAMVEYETRDQAMEALDQLHNRRMEGWHMALKALVCD